MKRTADWTIAVAILYAAEGHLPLEYRKALPDLMNVVDDIDACRSDRNYHDAPKEAE